ncbi:MAG: STAS domain-containing protein [bacterium]|nr:STAS domain-containing protein [bacterium]
MKIEKKLEGKNLYVAIEGRLDTNSAPELEAAMNPELDSADNVVFDMKKLDYVTSAGLRIVLNAKKSVNGRGEVTLRNVSPVIKEVFEITGFAAFLKFE